SPAVPSPPRCALFPYPTLFRSKVERGERLVEQQQRRLDGQRAAERHPLALAARQLVRPARREPGEAEAVEDARRALAARRARLVDRKSTRLNSSHLVISYAVFC